MQPAPSPLDSPSPLCWEDSISFWSVSRRWTTRCGGGGLYREWVHLRPEEGPAVLIRLHVRARGRLACVGAAGSVGRAEAGVVLVVRLEDGECLLSGDAGVVRALGGLDGL